MKQGAAAVRVSIVMPVYNHARWVGEAVESVLGQTFSDFELILIDDASQDESWEVMQSFNDSRLRCIRHAHNQGAPATLNEGLARARGEYLAIINSDDVWQPERLARLLAEAGRNHWDFVASDVALLDVDSHPKEVAEPHWTAWFEGLKREYREQADLLATLLHGNFLITTSNFFFHRRVYTQLGGFANLRYVHDYDYLLRICTQGFRMQVLLGEKLLAYRLHDSNTIREKPLAAIEENMGLLLDWLPHLHGNLEPQRLQGLQAQLQDLYRYTREEWLTGVHQRLREKEQELLPLIADRDQWIADRDRIIQALRQDLFDHRLWIAEREQWVADRDRWIAERDGWIAERDGRIQEAGQAVQVLNDHVRQQQQWISDRDEWIRQRDAWIAERDASIRLLRQQRDDLLNSRAFRLGESLLAPLRRFRQWLWGARYA